jgi:N-glycosylase/DNA lyase
MKIRLSESCPFNLDATLCCGQIFRWQKEDEWRYGIIKNTPFKLRQSGSQIEFENINEKVLSHYLGLNDDLPKIYKQINKDGNICRAIKEFKGLRIVNQDPWECLISYICATYKNIPAIERMLTNLSKMFGESVSFEQREFYTFPTAETLAKAKISDLEKCGLGYRAKYVLNTAKKVLKAEIDFRLFKLEDYGIAKKHLLELPGVGPKGADCILLFSLEKKEAFPIDVWVKRVLLKYYSQHLNAELVKKLNNKDSLTPSEYNKLNSFGREYFGKHAGYAQEYLYHYERTKASKTT